MAVVLKRYEVYYLNKKGKECKYTNCHALCPDGAEEAARLDCKNLKEIIKTVEII